MTVVVMSGVAMVVAWCLIAFAVAAVIGRTFARSEQGEPWCAGPSVVEPAPLVQTAATLKGELPARRPVTY